MAKLGNLKGATGSAGATGASLNGSGAFASRPAAGTAGRIYYATDIGAAYEDNGSSWIAISPTGGIPKTVDTTSAIPGTGLSAIVTLGPFPAALMVAGTVVEVESFGLYTDTSSGTFTIDIGKTGNSSGARVIPATGVRNTVAYRITALVIITSTLTLFTIEFVAGNGSSAGAIYRHQATTTLVSVPWAANDTITLQTQNSASGVILTPSFNVGRLVSVGA